MKKYPKCILILISVSCYLITVDASAQYFDFPSKVIDKSNILITYSITYKQDTTDLGYQRREDMYLFIGEKTSLFTSKNLYQLMLFGRIAEKEGKLDNFFNVMSSGKYRTRFSYSIYKNHPKGMLSYTDKVLPTFFIYEEYLRSFKWILMNDQDTLNGYSVQKASLRYGGRLWTAWYSTEIPISDGPYKFYGLPGLILKVSDSLEHYVFEMKEIERLEKDVLIEILEIDWVKTNRKDFLQAEQNFRHDIINRAKEAGASSESQQTAARNMMKKNNPIEF
jgi:GLPGLI family protein